MVHATVNRIWSSVEEKSMIDAQFLSPKTVLFKIENDQLRQRVLRRHFWHIANIPLVVREWNPSTVDSKPDLTMIPLWVDLKNVPDNLFSDKGLRFLGDRIGSMQRLHPKTERCVRLDVARLLIVVNLEQPLPNKINLIGLDTVIQVSYPWLPSRCSVCNEWGHDDKGCEKLQKGAAVESNVTPVSLPEESSLQWVPKSVGGIVTTDTVENKKEEVMKAVEDDATTWSLVTKSGRQSPVRSPNPIVEMNIGSASQFQVLSEGCEEGEVAPVILEDAASQPPEENPDDLPSGSSPHSEGHKAIPKLKAQRHKSRPRAKQTPGLRISKQSVTTQTSRKASLGKH